MTEALNKQPVPPDTILLKSDYFMGCAYIINSEGKVEEINFTVNQPHSLKPFKYVKPTVKQGGDPNNPNDIEYQENTLERIGVRPLQLITMARRSPNHLHEVDDAILCAVLNTTDNCWETRYFPKKNLPAEIWLEAMDLLNIGNR